MYGSASEFNVGALHAADPRGLYIEALSEYPYMMTPEDVAQFLGQTPQAVTQYLREKCMRGVKTGRFWRVPKKMLIEYLYDHANAGQRGDCNGSVADG